MNFFLWLGGRVKSWDHLQLKELDDCVISQPKTLSKFSFNICDAIISMADNEDHFLMVADQLWLDETVKFMSTF